MRLHIRKQLFSLLDRYTITDDNGNTVYHVQGHLFSFGKKLDLLDSTGNEVAKIHQNLFTLTAEYEILEEESVIAVVTKEWFTFLNPRFTVESRNGIYEMSGDWLSWNYEIHKEGRLVAEVNKQFDLFQDRYAMEILEEQDTAFLLCLAIIIDEVTHPKG